MWLTPFSSQQRVCLSLLMHVPTSISGLQIWNYARTPSRGARKISICADNLLVCAGELHCAQDEGGVDTVVLCSPDVWQPPQGFNARPVPRERVGLINADSSSYKAKPAAVVPTPSDRPTTSIGQCF